MRSQILITLLAFVALAQANEGAYESMHTSGDHLVNGRMDKLINKLVGKAKKVEFLNDSNLDHAMLLKPRHASIPTSRVSQISSLPSPEVDVNVAINSKNLPEHAADEFLEDYLVDKLTARYGVRGKALDRLNMFVQYENTHLIRDEAQRKIFERVHEIVDGLRPHEMKVLQLLRAGFEKRALKFAKKRMGTFRRARLVVEHMSRLKAEKDSDDVAAAAKAKAEAEEAEREEEAKAEAKKKEKEAPGER